MRRELRYPMREVIKRFPTDPRTQATKYDLVCGHSVLMGSAIREGTKIHCQKCPPIITGERL